VLFGVARWFALPVTRQSAGETTFVPRDEDGQYASNPAGTQPHSTQARRACLPSNVHSLDKQFKWSCQSIVSHCTAHSRFLVLDSTYFRFQLSRDLPVCL